MNYNPFADPKLKLVTKIAMKKDLKQFGDNIVWGTIEAMSSPLERIYFRKTFEEIGGAIPKNFRPIIKITSNNEWVI